MAYEILVGARGGVELQLHAVADLFAQSFHGIYVVQTESLFVVRPVRRPTYSSPDQVVVRHEPRANRAPHV